jgi:predicted PurR-regulated permease PerM
MVMNNIDLQQFDWSGILEKVATFVSSSVGTIIAGAVVAVKDIFGVIFNLVISIVFAFYCLACKETLARQARRIAYSLLKEKMADQIVRIMRMTNSAFSNFITGQCLEAVILALLFVVAMAIFGMPYIPLICVVICITALVPVVGAFAGCILGAFFILVNDPIQAVSFIVMFLILQQLENNLIYPRVVGTSIGLPGMWVLVAVTIGGEIMGVAGMLVMIPLASVLYTLGREFTDRRLEQRQIPTDKLEPKPIQEYRKPNRIQERKKKRRLQKMKEEFLKAQGMLKKKDR